MAPPPVYHKRFRMEAEFPRGLSESVALPAGCRWVPWQDELLEVHAAVKAVAFAGELDATIFPSLGHSAGCVALMNAIRKRAGFCPQSTWLIATPTGFAGTVQGLVDGAFGAVQNLGVVPGWRGRGLGRALLLQCVRGFCQVGLHQAYLEVTAANRAALALYRRSGFACTRTIYKPEPVPVGVPAS